MLVVDLVCSACLFHSFCLFFSVSTGFPYTFRFKFYFERGVSREEKIFCYLSITFLVVFLNLPYLLDYSFTTNSLFTLFICLLHLERGVSRGENH